MQQSFFLYDIIKRPGFKLIILKDNAEIDELAVYLRFFKDFFGISVNIETFYSYEIPPVSSIPPSSHIKSSRIKSLYSLISGDKDTVFLTNLNAVLQPVISEEVFFDKFLTIHLNKEVDLTEFIKKLSFMNYERKDFAECAGDFSKRGDIIDIFSPLYDKPLRVELFGDEIESIKLFYPANQRTFKSVGNAVIPLASEYGADNGDYGYCNLFKKNEAAFLIDYDNIKTYTVYKDFEDKFIKEVLDSLNVYKTSYGCDIYLPESRLKKFIGHSSYADTLYGFNSVFPDNLSIDEKILKIKKLSSSSRVVIACASDIRAQRVGTFLSEKNIAFSKGFSEKNGVYLSSLYLKKGFADKKERLVFVSFEDLFGRPIQRHPQKISSKSKTFIQDSKVVHKSHGIGIYRGIKKIYVEDRKQDFIEIEYAKGDKLYVPVYGVDNIFEYRGSGDLSLLGSNRWKNTQENIKKSLKKILSELVNTYAKRQLVERKPFAADTFEYREFEAMFEYEETEDQTKAILDIKSDMQNKKPMDRLICGDVSFGKTEVAMRAAAISVFNEKQVVFMAPTTVLSLQHYKTFKDRFAQFPVNIAVLNRFNTKKERDYIIENLKKGIIDILISTHSVYTDKIKFADLGLVIIDEEHRFGVKIKEHLKSKYPYVDMLYLSATPIPRTLNMALNGIFDISVIKTAPLQRKPIETFILKRKQSVIRDAILKELSRKGSVYFVHNNIETIESVKDELDKLVPFAKKSIIHAKMNKKLIKKTIGDFNLGKFEVLVSTSIIESGLDIRNVNTIIIDNADRFGLADLYQLRGRVGRGDRTAYAYLLIKGDISDDAKKRLYFLREFVERGVGFNLALKDMEIRGGGNILGKDQSGSIRSVGFETYASLIEEAVSELKNEPIEREVEIKCSYPAYIGDDFADSENKFKLYKIISSIKTEEELESVEREIADSFGKFTDEVRNLFLIASLKIYAKKAFVKSLSVTKNGVLIEFYVDADIDTNKLIKCVEKHQGRFVSNTSVFFDAPGANFDEICDKLRNILQRIV